MHKKHILYVLGIISLLLVVFGCTPKIPAYPPPTCTDSDGGLNPDVAGTVVVSSVGIDTTYSDNCMTGTTVAEYQCKANFASMSVMPCDSGKTCQNGACIAAANPNNSTGAVAVSCTDSDGGLNPDVAGTVVVSSVGIDTTYSDNCMTGTTVAEYQCGGDNYARMFPAPCASGKTCQNGVCA